MKTYELPRNKICNINETKGVMCQSAMNSVRIKPLQNIKSSNYDERTLLLFIFPQFLRAKNFLIYKLNFIFLLSLFFLTETNFAQN